MRDATDLVALLKKSSIEATDKSKPTGVFYGTVKSTSPLSVFVEQRLTLTDSNLIVPKSLTNYSVSMIVSHETEKYKDDDISEHKHSYAGTKNFTVQNALKTDEKVILLRMQGGQKYLILDRIG